MRQARNPRRTARSYPLSADRLGQYWYEILVWVLVALLVMSCCSAAPPVQCQDAPTCNRNIVQCEQDLDECSSMLKERMGRLQ